MDQLFVFDDTKWAINELEQSIQDFMFALVGSWNLRCDIDGLLQNEPNISAKELAARYTIGANVVGCDLKGVRSRFSWKDYSRPDNPFLDVLSQSTKLSELVEKLANVPGLDRLLRITEAKKKKMDKLEEAVKVASANEAESEKEKC